MPKRFHKHKLLLDENMPHRTDLPLLNSKFDVKHLVDDLKHAGISDPEVYQLAVAQKRILVTFNTKHFRALAGTKDGTGVIGVSANLPTSQIDTKLTALLTRITPHALARKFTPLTGETEI
jgi:predicted nuclease of predicted toxin-antitoxin system